MPSPTSLPARGGTLWQESITNPDDLGDVNLLNTFQSRDQSGALRGMAHVSLNDPYRRDRWLHLPRHQRLRELRAPGTARSGHPGGSAAPTHVRTMGSYPTRDAGYPGRPHHPASHVLGLLGAEQLGGQEPGHPLAGRKPWFDNPPGTGRRLDRRRCDGFDGEAAVELRIDDKPAERCGVVGDGDQPESDSRVGGIGRPNDLVRSYAWLGPLAVPVRLRAR